MVAHRLLLAVAAVLVVAAPASAAEVARTDGWRLDARDGKPAGFCLRLTESDSALGGGGSGTCGQAPWRARRSNLIAWVSRGRLVTAGAVPASVTRAEAELVDGRRVAFDTVSGPRYRGRYAGRLRFFLAELPLADARDDEAGGLVAVRFFGADGTLAGVAAGNRSGTRVGRRRVLLRERGRGRSITVAAETSRRVVPTPLALDRMEDLACVVTRSREGGYGGGSSTICHEPGPNRPDLLVLAEPGCGTVRTVLSGFVGDAVTALRVKLGSGRVREVRAKTFRDANGGEHRYVAAVVPRGEAVRSIAAVGADAGYELGEKPSGLPCLNTGGSISIISYLFTPEGGAARPPGDGQVAAEADGHRLLVRDAEADRLCAGIDRLAADGEDCQLPAVNGEDAWGTADSGMVAAVLPAEVARVRLPDGREVPTVAGGYSGPYAGTVRFLLAKADAGDTRRIRLLDASGAAIASLPVFSSDALEERPVAGPVRIAAGRGWRLSAARHRYGSCVYLALSGDDGSCLFDVPESDGAMAAVGCAPRVAVIAGRLSREVRMVRAVLRGGRTLRARIVRVPRRFGGGRAWVLALPRGARVKAVRIGGRLHTFPLLPAKDQCGYRVYAPALFGVAEPELELRSP